ncbi:MAG TPA: VCBS repeat-containing protein [Gemmataceae bacterium]|nr:VCBS repeat-containing protein [Gemmataceae bacterium]
MNPVPPVRRPGKVWPYVLACAVVAATAAAGLAYLSLSPPPFAPALPAATPVAVPNEDSPERVHKFCSECHKYPDPESFPRHHWRAEVRQAYDFLRGSSLSVDFPPFESVVRYYEERAPEELPLVRPPCAPAGTYPIRFEREVVPGLKLGQEPTVSHVSLVHLFDAKRLDVLTCDMHTGWLAAYQPYTSPPAWRKIARLTNPAHAEVVDLDGDGNKDLIVADLGNFTPTNAKCGSVVWLRGKADGTFTPITLLEGVGRVADVQAADFNGDGKIDLIVAVFGWRETGAIIYLENQTTDWDHPKFVPHVVDDRHGAIHVPVTDLNGDGKPDFVALISQEHETIVAFLNDGKGHFEKKTLYEGPHPAYGSSGIQLVDLDGDGRLDILYTNGDVLDQPFLLKPYHGIQWLENVGDLRFVHHPITPLYGAMRAVAVDLRGDGKKDILAVSWLPASRFPQRGPLDLDAVILLEQTERGKFVRHALAKKTCDSLACTAGDVFGDGHTHLVTASFGLGKGASTDALTIWKNLGPRKDPPGK